MNIQKFHSIGLAVSDDLRTASAVMDGELYKLLKESKAQININVQDDVEIIIKAKKDCGKCPHIKTLLNNN